MLNLTPLLVLLALSATGDTARVMDGEFDDWTSKPVAHGNAGSSISTIRVADDPHYVYLQIDLDKPSTLQGLDEELRIEFDLDGEDETGTTGRAGLSGVDAMLLFSPLDPRDGQPDSGSALLGVNNGRTSRHTTDALGVVAMPTYGSERFEIRLNRMPAFRGDSFDAQLVTTSPDGASSTSTPFSHTFQTRSAKKPLEAIHDPARAASPRGIRVTSWNGQDGALFKNPGPFARSFEALEPDLVLLQELPSKEGPTQLAQWFDRLEGDNTWTVAISGGSLKVGVATPHKLEPVQELARIEAPDPRGTMRTVRAVGALATIKKKRILAVSLHLKCCGRLGSSEDQKRRSQVDGIHEAVRLAITRLKPDGVIIGGDFNLVGSRAILDRLCDGLAPDGSDLVVTEPIRPVGDATTTWQKNEQAFVPGQLDFILVGGDWEIDSALVVDPAQMSAKWRREHGIAEEHPSDHLLISVDLNVASMR